MAENEKKYHHGALKQALVAAGLDLLEEAGLEGLSLRAIAARVGVSHTAPKNHFGGLTGLTSAIAAEGFRRHAAAMQAQLPDGADRRTRLRAAAEGYVGFALDHPALFQLMFSPLMCDLDDPDLRAAAATSRAVLTGLAEGLDWPALALPVAMDRQLRTEWMLWSMVHGYATLAIAGHMPRGSDGRPVLPFAAVMPDFGYLA